ncbi:MULTISPECIES: uroporphyrinogen-III C-methyltransferase [Photorhabdus]|uniref:Uroporphyrin-III C-methyltransferase (Urogen III methylase) n=2 Tax=Photorhabdus laumondii subsp. laumondii TaxID=141679 RepID=Q7MYN0_PHOLL|nr:MULTISPECIES: uroporphyrinogen-III C-methyltransferase [Photorhabdus]AWK44159.1 uroporphyrinogen-III C-methyltransferase [Photorhabdus laumondii subsp. laumondii]KTL62499.1 heme biosynthesis operon protein HemX [Photorhabdus laumondii subsp. laumondii]MCC8383435.1 uroporphyrinogen-III C-methyltransferase [Photorhabdus laumondii]MCC8387970.1 uroporphyrinogen-III C-methyltransferase [Photorhabdus laumondii]MCC8411506.1 uroporphyrinogen-III C-methyltransferase [Photorhabdus laumondii]
MTEQKQSSETVEQTKTTVENSQQLETAPQKQERSGTLKNIIAIAIMLAIGGGLYYYGQQQSHLLSTENHELRQQLESLKQQQSQDKQHIEALFKEQSQTLSHFSAQNEQLGHSLQELQAKISALSSSDVKSWLLAQADFLVKMAGRKLWNDQDIVTAAALLKNADASLSEMNDPSLIEIRRAITQDISTLSAISQIDFDGIILRVNQLSNQVDNLRLADNTTDGSPMDEDNDELTGTLSEWRQNLSKSWKSFMDNFITIRRRDTAAEPLLAPNQDIYLRENIRARLLIAAQAIPRHQGEVFKQSLETVSTWVRAYFDINDPNTKAFLEEIDSLSQQPVSITAPDHLSSQPLLEKLMQTRVRSLLSQSSETNQEG